MAESDRPPDNCPVCLLHEQRDQESYGRKLLDGVAYDGQSYHLDDFVLFRAESGPAHIGYITNILFPVKATSRAPTVVTVKRVGRVSDLVGVLPSSVIKDEVSVPPHFPASTT
jgi:DNA (cytosine-5)-methyltransferase 1